MTSVVRCYFAAALFSEGERAFNASLAARLEQWCSVYLPQRDGLLLKDLKAAGDDSASARKDIFTTDISAIETCDVLIAVLDGASIDDGVSFEVGYATCLGMPVVGLVSDSRRAEGYFKNPMWEAAMSRTFASSEELVAWASALDRSWVEAWHSRPTRVATRRETGIGRRG